jgi:thiol-disulfide isomerase/thioredoxin
MKLFTNILMIITLASFSLFSGGKTDEPEDKMEKPMMEKEMTPVEKDMMSPLTDFESMDKAMMQAESHPTVLFFHASWCPSCKGAREDFESNLSQLEGINILIVDYDSSKELQKKYAVTYQHTFVQISPDGESLAKWNGGGTVELLKNIVKM